MIVAVDFDGTLAVTDYPKIVSPKTEVIEFCKKRKFLGDTLILWTCRHDEYLDEAIEWCKQHGLEFDYINESSPDQVAKYGESRKVYADIYIDDHNYPLCFIED
jgi:2-hydroxy-3-keto-5-methylthiopentenyl-1-phosphate phosphatase